MPAKQPKMNPAERRRTPRGVLVQLPTGTLQIHVNNRCLDVVRIHDTSPFGACLQLKASLDKGAQIRLTFTHKGVKIEALGTVVWQKTAKSPDPKPPETLGCWVGIFLHPSATDANFALCQAIKEGQKDWPLDECGDVIYW